MKQVQILSGGAAQGLVAAMSQAFLEEQGHSVGGKFGAVGAMESKLRAGAPADLVILTRRIVERLAADGLVDGSTITDIGIVQTGVAVRAGDVSTADRKRRRTRCVVAGRQEIYLPDPVLATAACTLPASLRLSAVRAEVEARLRPYQTERAQCARLRLQKAALHWAATQVTEILATPACASSGSIRRRGLATITRRRSARSPLRRNAAARLIAQRPPETPRRAPRSFGFEEESFKWSECESGREARAQLIA